MILVDTSVWIDHFRKGDGALRKLLESRQVLCHPFVIGELAMGNLRRRQLILNLLHSLPLVSIALDREVLDFITNRKLFGMGIGYIDVHLLAAVRLTPGTLLWTRDSRLSKAAAELSLGVAGLS